MTAFLGETEGSSCSKSFPSNQECLGSTPGGQEDCQVNISSEECPMTNAPMTNTEVKKLKFVGHLVIGHLGIESKQRTLQSSRGAPQARPGLPPVAKSL